MENNYNDKDIINSGMSYGEYANIVDNVNVSEKNDVWAFCKVASTFICVIFLIFICLNGITNIIISNLPLNQQIKLEKFLSESVQKQFKDLQSSDNNVQLEKINRIEKNIISRNDLLKEKGHFKYHIIHSDEVNAFVTADGSIYFTDKLLKEMPDEELLTFVMAHEMAHYIHKDHLKSFSRGISSVIIAMGLSAVTNDKDIVKAAANAIDFTEINHSHSQEINADKFANKITLEIYHSNKEVIKFFEYIDKEENAPSLLYFLSTHPSPQTRIKLLRNKNI